jgi:hypothetical protein
MERITTHDLLMACPDDQITRLQIAWRRTAEGEWLEAAQHLRNAAKEGDSAWHGRCAALAAEFEGKGRAVS